LGKALTCYPVDRSDPGNRGPEGASRANTAGCPLTADTLRCTMAGLYAAVATVVVTWPEDVLKSGTSRLYL
ncbi:hypothetical protein, partial [Arthrobacter sp. NPDC056493]|uniref:hypothetical protein n=1 Tax=Arthrobacter sp. NPDC056493 TaxID=3345839 RepID=UPI00366DB25C